MERIAATVSESLGAAEGTSSPARCENVGVLAVQLQQMLKGSQRKHFLVWQMIGVSHITMDVGAYRVK